jgi:hypothetical protein
MLLHNLHHKNVACTILSCGIDLITFKPNITILIRLKIVHILAVIWYFVREKLGSIVRDDIYSGNL